SERGGESDSEEDRGGRRGLGPRRSAPGEPRTDLAKRAHWRPEYLGHRGPAGILSAVSPAPQISVVIPCLDEEQAVGAVVDQAWEGIDRSGRTGEVIVVDNGSTDDSAEIAVGHGATVVVAPRRGHRPADPPGPPPARGD